MTAAIHTVANLMRSKVVSLMQTSYFSLVLDEATDISIREQVVISVRAWDTAGIASGQVRSMLLGVEEVSSPTAERIFSVVSDKLEEECIPWENLIGYTSGGANVMQKNSVLTRLVEKKPDLFSLHCTCHQLHLCASAACRVLPGSIEDFLRQTAYFFDHSPKRCAALRQVQATLGVPQHKLIKPAGTSWLSLHQCVERTLEQWDALQTYFSTNSDVCHRDNVRQFVEIMRYNNTRPLLQFLQEVLEHFTKLNKEFQSEEVLIYKLHHCQLEFLRFMLCNCLKSSALAEASLDLCLTVDLGDSSNWISAEDIVISADCCKSIDAVLTTPRKLEFLDRCRRFYLEASHQLRSRLSHSFPVLQGIQMRDPNTGKRQTASNVYTLASKFPSVVPSSELTKVQREWQMYQVVVADHPCLSDVTVDEYWHEISQMSGHDGLTLYPVLAKLANALLVIPHSGADVERHFSALQGEKSEY